MNNLTLLTQNQVIKYYNYNNQLDLEIAKVISDYYNNVLHADFIFEIISNNRVKLTTPKLNVYLGEINPYIYEQVQFRINIILSNYIKNKFKFIYNNNKILDYIEFYCMDVKSGNLFKINNDFYLLDLELFTFSFIDKLGNKIHKDNLNLGEFKIKNYSGWTANKENLDRLYTIE